MRSTVAEKLVAARRARSAALTPDEALAKMRALGARERRRLVEALGITDAEARSVVRRGRALGRKPSVAGGR